LGVGAEAKQDPVQIYANVIPTRAPPEGEPMQDAQPGA
jgi:hypothetical protein